MGSPQPQSSRASARASATADEGLAASGTTVRVPEHGAGTLVGGRYRLEKRLGAGAMGEVWRARHEELNIDVAVKLALVDRGDADRDRMLERFRFEAQISAQLAQKTDHIVAVFDAGRDRDTPFMVMELVVGRTLDEIIDGAGCLAVARVAEVIDQVSLALSAAHAHKIWHRDIKGANIMVAERTDGRWLVKVADFGVAKSIASQLDVDAPSTTVEGALVGTPPYMSPEQISGAAADAGGDLWSLAVMAYEALTGTPPFEGTTLAELMGNIAVAPHAPPSAHRALPKTIDAWFRRALAKRPGQRFESAEEMARTFRAATAAPVQSWRWAALAVGLLGIAGGAAYMIVRHAPNPARDAEAASAISAPSAVEPDATATNESATESNETAIPPGAAPSAPPAAQPSMPKAQLPTIPPRAPLVVPSLRPAEPHPEPPPPPSPAPAAPKPTPKPPVDDRDETQ